MMTKHISNFQSFDDQKVTTKKSEEKSVQTNLRQKPNFDKKKKMNSQVNSTSNTMATQAAATQVQAQAQVQQPSTPGAPVKKSKKKKKKSSTIRARNLDLPSLSIDTAGGSKIKNNFVCPIKYEGKQGLTIQFSKGGNFGSKTTVKGTFGRGSCRMEPEEASVITMIQDEITTAMKHLATLPSSPFPAEFATNPGLVEEKSGTIILQSSPTDAGMMFFNFFTPKNGKGGFNTIKIMNNDGSAFKGDYCEISEHGWDRLCVKLNDVSIQLTPADDKYKFKFSLRCIVSMVRLAPRRFPPNTVMNIADYDGLYNVFSLGEPRKGDSGVLSQSMESTKRSGSKVVFSMTGGGYVPVFGYEEVNAFQKSVLTIGVGSDDSDKLKQFNSEYKKHIFDNAATLMPKKAKKSQEWFEDNMYNVVKEGEDKIDKETGEVTGKYDCGFKAQFPPSNPVLTTKQFEMLTNKKLTKMTSDEFKELELPRRKVCIVDITEAAAGTDTDCDVTLTKEKFEEFKAKSWSIRAQDVFICENEDGEAVALTEIANRKWCKVEFAVTCIYVQSAAGGVTRQALKIVMASGSGAEEEEELLPESDDDETEEEEEVVEEKKMATIEPGLEIPVLKRCETRITPEQKEAIFGAPAIVPMKLEEQEASLESKQQEANEEPKKKKKQKRSKDRGEGSEEGRSGKSKKQKK